jgi:site-specific recombinase XerD
MVAITASPLVGHVDSFRYHLLAGGKKQATIKNYVQSAGVWTRWCLEHEVDPYTQDRNIIMAWLGQRSLDSAPSTIRLFVLSLRVYYDYLLSIGLATYNPARDIKIAKQVSRPVEPFSQNELQRMFRACKGARERAMFLLLLGGGLRKSELAGITSSDVNFSSGTVRIWGKGGKYRLIRPGTAAMKELEVALWCEERLIDRDGGDYIWRRVKAWAKKAGIEERSFTHRFRYTFATQFLEGGGSIEHLQTILGHTSLQQSLNYSKAGREERALAAQQQFNPADRLL